MLMKSKPTKLNKKWQTRNRCRFILFYNKVFKLIAKSFIEVNL